MKDLIEKLEKATGPDRDLDFAIAFAVQWRPQTTASRESFAKHEAKHDYATAWTAHAPFRHEWPIPRYTGSIDAALTLVPDKLPKHSQIEMSIEGDRSFSSVSIETRGEYPGEEAVIAEGDGKTLALALCIAALKARAKSAGDA